MRERRRALSASQQASHASAVAKAVSARLEDGGDTVGVYLMRDGELDLTPLIEICWQRGVSVAVPVIGRQLRFAAYRRNESMRRNRFGIAEPAEPAWCTPTLLLAPLVAFDATGQRLGMGGGYYDRYLSAHPDLRRIGVAHECQRVASVPAAHDDVPLSAVVTECGWQSFAPLADTR